MTTIEQPRHAQARHIHTGPHDDAHSAEVIGRRHQGMAKTFRRELLDFRVSYTAVGNGTFGAREGAHDDLMQIAHDTRLVGLLRPARSITSACPE
jgi:hypothetical protein